MLQAFRQYITDKNLFQSPDNILLAVSGGLDSSVMCRLFHEAGYSFAIAHCNFQLRGEESDQDEIFAQNLARKYKVPFFSRRFDTGQYAEERKISIQMAARDLRYQWFEELMRKEKYDFTATAHHKNDLIETLLLNLCRGTGIHGLQGIRPSTGKIVRPLLFAEREDIENYARSVNLDWREDSSNESVKYQRNLLRHKVIPVLKKINPGLEETMEKTLEKIGAVERIFNHVRDEAKKQVLREKGADVFIHIETLLRQAEPGILLFEFIKSYGFNYSDSTNLLLSKETGKKIESASHTAVRDRESFVISPKASPDNIHHIIQNNQKELVLKETRLLFSMEENKNFSIPGSPDIACLDLDKLQFPLILRKWEPGDSFYPLGMKGKKKISDLLVDLKVPLNLKERVTVLVSGESIVWVTGVRIDNRFRVSEHTRKILVIKKENL